VTLALKVATQMLHATRSLNMVIISVKVVKFDFKSQSYGPETILLKSYCDLDLQGRDPNVVRDTSSQHGDHLCEIVFKKDFK